MSRPARVVLVLVVLAALVGAAIVLAGRLDLLDGDDDGDRAPLTGEPTAGADLDRPALGVKIDNVAAARPQSGLAQADVVYEERVEGFLSRFLAVFHSRDADPVGPIRSGRSTDVAILAPLDDPLFAYSGANPTFTEIIRSAPLVDVGAEVAPGAYFRRPDRPAPHDLYSDTATLYAQAPDGGRPSELFAFADDAPAIGAEAQGVTFDFGSAAATRVSYTWDGARDGWLRSQNGTPHVTEDGTQLAPDHVLVQFVDYVDSGVNDASGSPIPEAVLVGDGNLWALTGGRVVTGSWSRSDDEAVTELTTDAGGPLELRPGRTWVALVPEGHAVLFCGDGTESTTGECPGA